MEKTQPIPQGKYVPATRVGNFVFTAGMTPRKNGLLIYQGKVKADVDLEQYRNAVNQAVSNALIASESMLRTEERIQQVLQLNVYINAEKEFEKHSQLADFATEYLYEALGEAGIAARMAIGIATLPGDAPVEVQMISAIN